MFVKGHLEVGERPIRLQISTEFSMASVRFGKFRSRQ